MADSLTTVINIQGTHSNNNSSMHNQEVGQDTLQDQPLVVAKAMEGAIELVDHSMVTEVGGIHLEASVANEVEEVGPLDKPIQLQGPMISTTGRKK